MEILRFKPKKININAGDTTNIIGGQITGNRVKLIASNLNIESLQDTAVYDSQQKNISGQITVGAGWGTVSGSASKSNIDANYASVNEQSGIIAGDKGYDVGVTNNTNLIGGIITSTLNAEENGLNSFSTGTLAIKDIRNYANASVDSAGYSLSTNDFGSKYTIAKAIDRNLMDSADESESSSSTTYSAINTDNITIVDNETQLALTGKTVEETISNINHNITNANTTLEQIDYEALVDDVETERRFYNNVADVALSQVDLFYRMAFVIPSQIEFQQCDEGGQNCHPAIVDLSDVKAANGQIFIYNNGIFNSLEFALANAAQQSSDKANAQGVYVIYNPETGSLVAEMLYALYDKTNEFLDGALPLTNAEITNQEIMFVAKDQGAIVNSVNHSRGSMTYYIAVAALLNDGLTDLPIGTVTFNGAAANAQDMANLVNTATDGTGVVQYSTHATDLVGLWIGGNLATGGLDSYGFPDSHSSYGPNAEIDDANQAWGEGQTSQPQVVNLTN